MPLMVLANAISSDLGIPGIKKSAAEHNICKERAAPPTEALYQGVRNPEVITIFLPNFPSISQIANRKAGEIQSVFTLPLATCTPRLVR